MVPRWVTSVWGPPVLVQKQLKYWKRIPGLFERTVLLTQKQSGSYRKGYEDPINQTIMYLMITNWLKTLKLRLYGRSQCKIPFTTIPLYLGSLVLISYDWNSISTVTGKEILLLSKTVSGILHFSFFIYWFLRRLCFKKIHSCFDGGVVITKYLVSYISVYYLWF